MLGFKDLLLKKVLKVASMIFSTFLKMFYISGGGHNYRVLF